jgi:replicative DNA helicase
MNDALRIRFAVHTEQWLLAAALRSEIARQAMLRRLPQDAFIHEKHAVLWAAIRQCERDHVEPDDAALHRYSSGTVDLAYVHELRKQTVEVEEKTLQLHITEQRWDGARIQTLKGPVNAFLDEASKPNADPTRVVALADQISRSLTGYEDRKALYTPEDLAREVRLQLSEARGGHAIYPYGIPGLDLYESGEARIIPGAKPGQITLLTAVSGSGKSTIAARMAIGLAKQKRRVLYGAWEPAAADMMTLMALMDLGYSRTMVSTGNFTAEQEECIAKRALELGKYITLMGNPFAMDNGGREKRPSNENNIDLIEGYISDTGADIFIADLWERCLVALSEVDERLALFRIQRVFQRTKCHGILLAQQRLKDLEVRPDRRPTREGIKGSSAWVDVADTILGAHLPSLFKDIPDDRIEIIVLKQRWGKWPLAVQFDWGSDLGAISGGKSIAYNDPIAGSSGTGLDGFLHGKSAGASSFHSER